MKKIILLFSLILSLSFSSYGQAEFENIKLSENTTDNAASRVVVQSSSNVLNTISKSDLVNVVPYASAINLPVTGEDGKIYITKDNNKLYRWTGVIYQELAVTDLSNKVDKVIGKSLLSDTEITRLATLTDYTHPANHPASIITQDASNRFVTDTEKTTWNSKQSALGFTPENTANKVGTITSSTTNFPTNNAVIAYVAANSSSIPQLKYNNTDLTVWNNGKGDVSSNTSFGEGALRSNSTGIGNTASGTNSLSNNTSGSANTANGAYSLNSNVNGSYNTSFGYYSLFSNTTGISNTALGINSLSNNTSGSANTANGLDSGRYIANGSTTLTFSNNSVFLGAYTRALADNSTNEIVIGYNATGAGSNTATLGDTSITSTILRGAVTGGSFIKSGATATNLLQANGVDIAQLSLPISTATQTALDGKLNTSGGTLSGALTINSFLKFQTSGSEISTIATTLGLLGSGSSTDMNAYVYGNNEYGVWTNGVKRQTIAGNGATTFQSTVTASSLNSTNLAGSGDSAVGTDSAGNLKRIASTDSRPYKVYTALLTQTGTSAPVATVLENTLGGTLVWTRDGDIVGRYTATLTGAFTAITEPYYLTNNYGNSSSPIGMECFKKDNNSLGLYTRTGASTADGLMNGRTSIEIRVY